MAIELAEMYVSVIPEARGITPILSRQFRPAQSIAASAGRESGSRFTSAFKSATATVGRGLAAALKYGAGAAAVGIGAAGAVGLKTAAQLETAKIGFTTMLGSAKRARDFLGDLSNFAAKTPFDLPGLQESASSLVAIGIDAKDVIPIMTSLGNITSGMGTGAEGIDRATRAIQQMNAAGKITAEDLNQLRDAGVPVYDLLTKATGKTTKQIAEMRDKGELGRKELDALMELLKSGKGLERFNGLMQKQSHSLTGLASTFYDTFSVGLAKALKPIIPMLKDGLAGATALLADVILPKVQSGLAAVVKWGGQLDFTSFRSFMDSLAGSGSGEALSSIGQSFQQMWPSIQKMIAAMPSFSDVLKVTSGVMGFLADHMDTIIQFLPLIVAGFVAYKVAAMGLNALEQLRLPITIAQTVANIRLAASQRALLASQASLTTATSANTAATSTNTAAQRVGMLTRIRSAAAAVGQKAALVASTVATKAATIAQRALNLAMRMNPIGIIITAITALVAGLVWFFTKTEVGQKIVTTAWAKIKQGVRFVVAWFQAYVLPVIRKVWDGIAAGARWLHKNVILPAWRGIKAAVAVVAAWFRNVLMPGIEKTFDVIGGVFRWLWNKVVKPVFRFIKAYIRAWWTVVKTVFKAVVWFVENALAPAVKWLWNKVVKPAFRGIGNFIGWAWETLIRPVFRAVRNFIEDVLGPAVKWLWNKAIKPAFRSIGNFIESVWDDGIKPVFRALKKFITETIPDAFKTGVKGIKSFWEGLKAIAKAPVRFVVETVLNKGLFKGFNSVMDFIGSDLRIKPISLPRGFARGGLAKGWAMVGEEGPELVNFAHPGRVYTADQSRRALGTDEGIGTGAVANRIAGGGGAGHRQGSRRGFIWPVSKRFPITQYPSGGHPAYDIGTPIGTPVRAAAAGRVTKAGPGYRAPGVWGGTEAWIGHGGVASLYAHLSRLLVGVGDRVKRGEVIARSGNTGISSGPHLHFGAFRNGQMVSPAPWLSGKAVGGVGGGSGFNPLAWVAEQVTDVVKGLIEKIPGAGAFFDIAVGVGKYLFDKAKDWAINMVTPGDQQPGIGSAIAPTLMDNGGKVMPGRTDVLNLHRKPEALLNPQQWSTAHRAMEVVESRAGEPSRFEGDLYLDSGEFLGKVRGVAGEVTDDKLHQVSRKVGGMRR